MEMEWKMMVATLVARNGIANEKSTDVYDNCFLDMLWRPGSAFMALLQVGYRYD